MSFVLSHLFKLNTVKSRKKINKLFTNLDFLAVNMSLGKAEDNTTDGNFIFLKLSMSATDYRHIAFSLVTSGTILICAQGQ